MATHAPTTGAPTRAPVILTAGQLSSLGGTLQSIADFIDGLGEVIGDRLAEMRKLMRDPDCRSINFADVGDWRVPEVMLSLLRRQADEIMAIGERIETATVEGGC